MFAGLTDRLRVDIEIIKNVVDLNDHARTLFYTPVIEQQADSWTPLRQRNFRRSEWQIYNHCAAFTRLYAVYSMFLEDLIREFLRRLPHLYDKYLQLPPAVLKQHRIGFGQILLKLGEYGPYRHLREDDIIEQLSHGLAGNQPYALLADAFFVDKQNYRLEHLAKLLGHLGIENAGVRIARHPSMLLFLEQKRGGASLDSELGRFIQLRNEAAHSAVEEVIGAEEFRLFADFILIVCESVGELALRELLQRSLDLGQLACLGQVEHVYRGGTVAIIKMKAATVAVGEQVAVIRNGRIDRVAVVQSIRADDVERDSIDASDGQEIGLGLDRACKTGVILAKTPAGPASPEEQPALFAPEDLSRVEEDSSLPDISEIDSTSETQGESDELGGP